MSLLQRIDAVILSFFTKISHKFQILTGRTNFFLAKCCLVIMALTIVTKILNFFIPLVNYKKSDLVNLLLNLVWVYWISKDLKNTKTADENILDNERARVPFVIGGNNYFFRLIWLLFVLLFDIPNITLVLAGITAPKIHWLFEILSFGLASSILAFVYFVAVTPLPPGKSKVRQWLESFGKVLKPIPVRSTN